MKLGAHIYLFYDVRPFVPNVRAYECEIIKRTKTGFKVKNLDEPGLYEEVIFYPNGTARGWNTLTWHPTHAAQAISDYQVLRKRMEQETANEKA